MVEWQAKGSPKYYRSPMLAELPEVAHGFFTRQGGVSSGAFDSLNVSPAVGDQSAPVAANQGLIQQALGLKGLARAVQVHGAQAAIITSAGQPGRKISRRWTSWSPPFPAWVCSSNRPTARRSCSMTRSTGW